MSQIVVGVDGSPESRSALTWAIEEAALRGGTVRAVYVYGHPDEPYSYLGAHSHASSGASTTRAAGIDHQSRDDAKEEARKQAEGMVASAVRDARGDHADVRVEQVAVAGGRAARALVEASREARMLVVGARGRGGFKGLRLGSVAEQCARHASVPVVIIRGERRRRGGRRQRDAEQA